MTDRYTYVENISEPLPEVPSRSIVSRTVHGDQLVKVTRFDFAAGEELTEHTATRPAILHFLRGSAELRLGEDRLAVEEGAWVYMPANLPHSLQARTQLTFLLLLLKAGE